MSIAMDRIDPSGYKGGVAEGGEGGGSGMACASVYDPPAICNEKEEEEEEEEEDWCSSSSTSSIGRNSDLSGRSSEEEDEDSEENEVQSSYKGPLLVMDSLEEALPLRRGISNFYNGKSKSFTSLAEASSASSVKEIAKQENAYTRRRRNILAVNHIWDKNRCSPLRNISKRPMISSSKSSLALAVAMSSSESISSTSEDSSCSHSRSPPRLPPLHPQSRASAWRSYSVADLQQCTADANSNSYLSYKTDYINNNNSSSNKKNPI
ncbi:hypothetical protein LWI28_022423 [Acer negundo]|uniref:Uncharacterized protein n=1 Tax=Acer negundo TaxID=4023 RepID=A0AAD5JAI1_ACENE|nr:hypothetical protein LWI28_022423 [Acer negundo]